MPDSAERRAAERLAVNAGTACAFAGKVAEDIGPAKIRDVSLEGVGLVTSRRVEVGALLAVTISSGSIPTRKWARTVLVRVTQVSPVHGGFLVGGTFTESLTYQEFTSLVM